MSSLCEVEPNCRKASFQSLICHKKTLSPECVNAPQEDEQIDYLYSENERIQSPGTKYSGYSK